jgi:hypothetical protein
MTKRSERGRKNDHGNAKKLRKKEERRVKK